MTRHWALVLLVGAIGAAYFLLVRAQDAAQHAAPQVEFIDVPERMGGYIQSGVDHDVGDRVRNYLETSQILVRRYTAPSGRPVELTIVHAAVTRRSLHFPEICLVGEGWDIRDQYVTPVGAMFKAKRLVLVRASEREAVLYWFQTGTRLTGNYFLNAWHWARDQVCLRSPVSAMIRLSTPIGNQSEDIGFSTLDDFAMKLAPIMQDYGRRNTKKAGAGTPSAAMGT